MRAPCWSRRPGRRCADPGRCAPSISGSPARRGNHIAAVAVARKLAVIVWHMLQKGEDYAGVRPALHAKKLRDLELRSGQPARRGQRGAGLRIQPDPDCGRRSGAGPSRRRSPTGG